MLHARRRSPGGLRTFPLRPPCRCWSAPAPRGGPVARATGLFDAYADASGYPSGYWTAYPVNGDFAQWCDDGLGIPTVEVELSDHVHPELERNLAGSLAVMQHITRNPPY